MVGRTRQPLFALEASRDAAAKYQAIQRSLIVGHHAVGLAAREQCAIRSDVTRAVAIERAGQIEVLERSAIPRSSHDKGTS
jgi:hypothetical protein